MASAHSLLMQAIGVVDIVDTIVEIDIRSNRSDVEVEWRGVLSEKDASLCQVATEFYEEFHDKSGVIGNWKGSRVFSEDLVDAAFEVTWSLAESVYSVQNKEEFLAVVKERHAGVAFSRMVATGYMSYVLEDARV